MSSQPCSACPRSFAFRIVIFIERPCHSTNDLVKDCDFVFCRNVFIYFDRSLQEQLLMKYYNALKLDGYLTMGKSETLIREATQIFEPIDVESRIYRKKAA